MVTDEVKTLESAYSQLSAIEIEDGVFKYGDVLAVLAVKDMLSSVIDYEKGSMFCGDKDENATPKKKLGNDYDSVIEWLNEAIDSLNAAGVKLQDAELFEYMIKVDKIVYSIQNIVAELSGDPTGKELLHKMLKVDTDEHRAKK